MSIRVIRGSLPSSASFAYFVRFVVIGRVGCRRKIQAGSPQRREPAFLVGSGGTRGKLRSRGESQVVRVGYFFWLLGRTLGLSSRGLLVRTLGRLLADGLLRRTLGLLLVAFLVIAISLAPPERAPALAATIFPLGALIRGSRSKHTWPARRSALNPFNTKQLFQPWRIEPVFGEMRQYEFRERKPEASARENHRETSSLANASG